MLEGVIDHKQSELAFKRYAQIPLLLYINTDEEILGGARSRAFVLIGAPSYAGLRWHHVPFCHVQFLVNCTLLVSYRLN